MRRDYESWLRKQGYAENTIAAQMYRVGKVEEHYGSLDELLGNRRLAEVISEMKYSAADERSDRANPSKIDFNGNIRKNLQSYRNATTRYQRFCEEMGGTPVVMDLGNADDGPVAAAPAEKQKLALERDMQNALRERITDLQDDLVIVDDGAERSVDSGFIDILCEDSQGALVVVELKAGTTDARVTAQILGYMGDLMAEEPDRQVRGIIVAHGFDKRTVSAIRVVPSVDLFSYSINFSFRPEG